jgi:hypothetical protein
MITIDEAIKELEKDIADFGGPGTSTLCQAERLGIEALKWRKHCEAVNRPERYPPLPGETEE